LAISDEFLVEVARPACRCWIRIRIRKYTYTAH